MDNLPDKELIRQSGLFDAEWYCSKYPDVALSGLAPVDHYLRIGALLQRDPHPLFSARHYMAELSRKTSYGPKSPVNPLLNYITEGYTNGVNPHPLFSVEWYLHSNPDLAEAKVEPLKHFLTHGVFEKRSPHPEVNLDRILSRHPELRDKRRNPLIFYIQCAYTADPLPRARKILDARSSSQSVNFTELYARELPRIPASCQPWIDKVPFFTLLSRRPNDLADTLPGSARNQALSALSLRQQSVSVIIPTHNRGSTIVESLRSALSQSFPPREIIVVDDGSSDNTLTVLHHTFARELESGVIRIISQPNQGVSEARNVGLKLATGDLIAYLDSDNTWTPDYLLAMAALFASMPEISTAYAGLRLHDKQKSTTSVRFSEFDRRRLLQANFIDLNVFMHRRRMLPQTGPFDTTLTRLVDWDFIIRATRIYEPVALPMVGVDYFLDGPRLGNITFTQPLDANRSTVLSKHLLERIRYGVEPIRLAYVLWDWPALSQTFVVEEVKWLVSHGYDVIVYYHVTPDKAATLDFSVECRHVHSAEELAAMLKEDGRNFCHSHFVYPAVTRLTWPACKATRIPFTLFAHAVDIFHHANRERNRVAEIAADPLCQKIYVPGRSHHATLEASGVHPSKIAYALQAFDKSSFEIEPVSTPMPRGSKSAKGLFIGRFVEKKGITVLLEALSKLDPATVDIDIYGYGPLAPEVHRMVTALALTNVRVRGSLESRAETASALKDADFLIVPSVVTSEGDTEGFPTVIFEAIAANKVVISTTVGSIPDYLTHMVNAILCIPSDSTALAEAISIFVSLPDWHIDVIKTNARRLCQQHFGTDLLMSRYYDTWFSRTVDVFTVTYITATDHSARADTKEVLRRLAEHTTTPHVLTIIDNGSEKDFTDYLKRLAAGNANIRLVFQLTNRFVGPSSNTAMYLSRSEYCIYCCSREAFVAKHGWEVPLISHMRLHADNVMAGQRLHLPKHTLGKELSEHVEFSKFRNSSFAKNNPGRVFKHIQGGCYIIATDTIHRHGGFSSELPHNLTDVELSYYLESIGCKLGSVPEIVSLTKSTLPPLASVTSEHTSVVHPLTVSTADELLAPLTSPSTRFRCNFCCGLLPCISYQAQCKRCGSTPFGRRIYSLLAHNWRAHRRMRVAFLCADLHLQHELGKRMFNTIFTGSRLADFISYSESSRFGWDILVADADKLEDDTPQALQRFCLSTFGARGLILISAASELSSAPPFSLCNVVSSLLGHDLRPLYVADFDASR